MNVEQVRTLLRQECESAGSIRAWARKNWVSSAYVGDVVAGRREPGDAVLTPLRLERIVTYRDLATDPTVELTVNEVRTKLRIECETFGSVRAWARKYKVSAAYAGDIVAGRREPGPAVMAPLSLERIVTYQPRKTEVADGLQTTS